MVRAEGRLEVSEDVADRGLRLVVPTQAVEDGRVGAPVEERRDMPRTEGARADLDRPSGQRLGSSKITPSVAQPAEVVIQRREVLRVGVDRLEDRAGPPVGALGVVEATRRT